MSKPGDVAVDRDNRRVMYTADRGWVDGDGDERPCMTERITRPPLVIDTEDREQASALLAALLRQNDPLHPDGSGIRAALRSLVSPPRPDEPTGLGAVVEDERGDRWVRGYGNKGAGEAWYCDHPSGPRDEGWQWKHYDDIAAVKVLSEGVTP